MTRFLDIVGSFLALFVLSPVFVVVMIVLKCTGEHEIFYRMKRVGRGGREFGMWKFSTMLKNSPSLPGGVLTQKDDPRVLPVGKFLRKTKINELPQLINILTGEMSFVGPRPQARAHYDLYSDEVKAKIDVLRPGLTGLGSLVFRDEEDILSEIETRGLEISRDQFHDTVIAPYKGELEKWYAEHRSLANYLLLIVMTAWSVVSPRTALHRRVFRNLPPIPSELKGFIG